MGLPLIRIISRVLTRVARDNEMTEPICVVVFRNSKKKYAYNNPGFDIRRGDFVRVIGANDVELVAEVVTMSRSDRWGNKATKSVLGIE